MIRYHKPQLDQVNEDGTVQLKEKHKLKMQNTEVHFIFEGFARGGKGAVKITIDFLSSALSQTVAVSFDDLESRLKTQMCPLMA